MQIAYPLFTADLLAHVTELGDELDLGDFHSLCDRHFLLNEDSLRLDDWLRHSDHVRLLFHNREADVFDDSSAAGSAAATAGRAGASRAAGTVCSVCYVAEGSPPDGLGRSRRCLDHFAEALSGQGDVGTASITLSVG